MATGHITDDKVHKRHAMHTFTDDEIKYLVKYMNDNFSDDIPTKNITYLCQQSDSVTYFKSTRIDYFTMLITDRGGPSKEAFFNSFGVPGHGNNVLTTKLEDNRKTKLTRQCSQQKNEIRMH